MASRFFKWVVEFQVDETWVEDGFDLTDERAHGILSNELRSAHSTELKAKVLKAPSKARIAKIQASVGK